MPPGKPRKVRVTDSQTPQLGESSVFPSTPLPALSSCTVLLSRHLNSVFLPRTAARPPACSLTSASHPQLAENLGQFSST